MLIFRNFSVFDWLKFKPLNFAFKKIRNDIWLKAYVSRKPERLAEFLEQTKGLKNKSVIAIVAFEQPWALSWLLQMAKKNLRESSVLVFDNSRNPLLRDEIEAVCTANNVLYFSLPRNHTKHVNRSHGMAMSWIFDNVIKNIEPKQFAFIDHDLIPVSQVDFSKALELQPFFGRRGGQKVDYWSLWAGYCLFDFKFLENKKINFLYDFSRGLDTGGRNWGSIYSLFDQTKIKFASRVFSKVYLPDFPDGVRVEFIDEKWVHMGSISYNDNFKIKSDFFKALASELEKDANWQRLLSAV